MRQAQTLLTMALCGLLLGACAEQEGMDDTEPAEEAAAEAPMAEEPAPTTSLADFAGTWDAVAYMESGDTVPHTITATASPGGWMIDLPDRDPLPMRVTLVGDSVVSEIGPYESVLREGVMVTVRSVTYLEDGRMVGTMEATYAGGEAGEAVVEGRVEGTRQGQM